MGFGSKVTGSPGAEPAKNFLEICGATIALNRKHPSNSRAEKNKPEKKSFITTSNAIIDLGGGGEK
ncbi:MAG: hypothetical protein J6126_02005 [Clostridia bacterium]|nr:hypothetical protein [Clostridia bacterium]